MKMDDVINQLSDIASETVDKQTSKRIRLLIEQIQNSTKKEVYDK